MATVGYGDIIPVANSEKIYAMFAMIIACGFTAYIIGSIGYIFNRSNIMVKDIKLKSFHINQFLIHNEIPNEIRHKIMSYLDYLAEYKKKYKLEEKDVLEMLNDNLKKQVIAFLNGNMLMDCPLFTKFSEEVISEITFLLTRKMFSVDDYVFEEQRRGDTMYFITKGSVILWEAKTHTYIREVFEGSTIGEGAFFSGKN